MTFRCILFGPLPWKRRLKEDAALLIRQDNVQLGGVSNGKTHGDLASMRRQGSKVSLPPSPTFQLMTAIELLLSLCCVKYSEVAPVDVAVTRV